MKKLLIYMMICLSCMGEQITPIDFSYLKEKMPKVHPDLLDIHFKLYDGYVKQVNFIDEEMSKTVDSFMLQSLRKQYGFEYDGMRLHELYFGQLGGKGKVTLKKKILHKITDSFTSIENFILQVKSYAKTRGIGWVILFGDSKNGDLKLTWVEEHEKGFLSGWTPILVMDLWEHAYISQFGLNKDSYIDLMFEYIDWTVVNSRYVSGCKSKRNPYKKYTKAAKQHAVTSHLK